MLPRNPVENGELTEDEIKKCEKNEKKSLTSDYLFGKRHISNKSKSRAGLGKSLIIKENLSKYNWFNLGGPAEMSVNAPEA